MPSGKRKQQQESSSDDSQFEDHSEHSEHSEPESEPVSEPVSESDSESDLKQTTKRKKPNEANTAHTASHPQCPPPHKAPPGQISRNTLDFLNCLRYEHCNQRDWLNDEFNNATYKCQFSEFNDFTQQFVTRAIDLDDNLPPYPSKDLVYRLSRDLRFAHDKTPYRKQFMMTFSKTGRKGVCAGYHLMVQPNGRTLFAVGKWQAEKDELASIRHHILTDPQPLLDVIGEDAFVKNFGSPNAREKGKRESLFGMDDELKVAPKGCAKDHPHIDLLKLRSFIVERRFSDNQVTSEGFLNTLMESVKISKPLVDLLNDWMGV
ncbi:hypothetical protein E3P84_00796 [Wallemia ichthyophaga]|nr:hypothetical protein E3P84_00796 [Wallemia ichthyophaga]TIB42970.1 hypothetical protein E3P83_00897 [Wallemia ichthyophaga]